MEADFASDLLSEVAQSSSCDRTVMSEISFLFYKTISIYKACSTQCDFVSADTGYLRGGAAQGGVHCRSFG